MSKYRFAPIILLLLAGVLLVAGCNRHAIRTDALTGPVPTVADRHDRYVAADDELSEQDQADRLLDTRILRDRLAEAESAGQSHIAAHRLEPVLLPVLGRHDTYVQADDALHPLERRTYLRTSTLLRTLLDEARGHPLDPPAVD